jgi:hypothetical protein
MEGSGIMGGDKHDQGKSDLSQVSWELVELLARVRTFGEKKYSRYNWRKGFKVTRSCAAALRHIFQFLSGQTNDSESGLSHLGHAVACLEHAIYDMAHHPENDDRYVPEGFPKDNILGGVQNDSSHTYSYFDGNTLCTNCLQHNTADARVSGAV